MQLRLLVVVVRLVALSPPFVPPTFARSFVHRFVVSRSLLARRFAVSRFARLSFVAPFVVPFIDTISARWLIVGSIVAVPHAVGSI